MLKITYAQLVNEAVAAMNEGDYGIATELFRAALPLRLAEDDGGGPSKTAGKRPATAAISTQARTILAQLGFEDEETPSGFEPDEIDPAVTDGDQSEVRMQELGRGEIPVGGGGLEEEPQGPPKDDLIALLRQQLNRNRAMRDPEQRETILDRIRNMAKLEPFEDKGGKWDVRAPSHRPTQEMSGGGGLDSLLGEASNYPSADQIRQAANMIRQK